MLLGKCCRPRQKWAHHFISLKVLSTAEQDIGKEDPFWKGLERRVLGCHCQQLRGGSNAVQRNLSCWELLFRKGFASHVSPAWINSSALHLWAAAALLCSHPETANSPEKETTSVLQRQLTGAKGKLINSCMEKQLQLHLKNWCCMFLGRKYSEMCCCSSLTLPICNSLCLRNTSRYVTVEDILFSYSTVALKQFWPLVPGDSCFWGGFFLW